MINYMMMYKGKSYLKARYSYMIAIKKTMQHWLLRRHIDVEFEEKWGKDIVPEDVKEGHIAVVAAKCEKPKRFVVELGCLTDPAFLRLLKKAGEEYGFKQQGAIAVPCEPEELQMILQEMRYKKPTM